MTKQVNCGGILIGGGAPVSVQSMTNVDTRDTEALVRQIGELQAAGCDIVRVAVPDMEAAESFGRARLRTDMPLVADIHFDYRLALAAIEKGADKIRINPGNIGSRDKLRAVVEACAGRSIPIRVGVNSGSLEKRLIDKYGGVTAEGLAESAADTLKIIEDMGYDQLVLSIKSTDVAMTYRAHMLVRELTDHPLHLGITEAGIPEVGRLKSAVGIGGMLLAGVGDTIRVSLTDDPVSEVRTGIEILEAVGMRSPAIEIVSCPTCGRTEVDLISLASEVNARLKPIGAKRSANGLRPLKVAVMGCAVNGPGEAREADFGIAGGKGEGLIIAGGEILKKVPEDLLVDELIKTIEKDGK